jgi:hypothetical protein
LYNGSDFWSPADAASSITQATRAIVWLNNNYNNNPMRRW